MTIGTIKKIWFDQSKGGQGVVPFSGGETTYYENNAYYGTPNMVEVHFDQAVSLYVGETWNRKSGRVFLLRAGTTQNQGGPVRLIELTARSKGNGNGGRPVSIPLGDVEISRFSVKWKGDIFLPIL